VLAYLFWHRPLDGSQSEAYEGAQLAFHRSLARTPPFGLRASAVFRVHEPPWLARAGASGASQQPGGSALPAATAPSAATAPPAGALTAYEDWYLIEDFSALGVLNEAAVGRGHRTSHDEVARRFGSGAGGLYGLLEGQAGAGVLGEASLATWIARPPGSRRQALAELLGDGIDPGHASLWRRQLVFGPAPEFCLLACEVPEGVAPTRLPAGWEATTLEREALWHG
jgi:hypothetical protein